MDLVCLFLKFTCLPFLKCIVRKTYNFSGILLHLLVLSLSFFFLQLKRTNFFLVDSVSSNCIPNMNGKYNIYFPLTEGCVKRLPLDFWFEKGLMQITILKKKSKCSTFYSMFGGFFFCFCFQIWFSRSEKYSLVCKYEKYHVMLLLYFGRITGFCQWEFV